MLLSMKTSRRHVLVKQSPPEDTEKWSHGEASYHNHPYLQKIVPEQNLHSTVLSVWETGQRWRRERNEKRVCSPQGVLGGSGCESNLQASRGILQPQSVAGTSFLSLWKLFPHKEEVLGFLRANTGKPSSG